MSEDRYSQAMSEGYDSLTRLPDVEKPLADALYNKGFISAEELSQATVEDLVQVKGIDEEKASILIEKAREHMAVIKTEVDAYKRDDLPEEPVENEMDDSEKKADDVD